MTTPELSEHRREIAVIGMSCRFPGAQNLEQFWNNLRDGVESVSTFTDEELLASGISAEVLSRPDYVKAGGVLKGIEEFDASFFGMSPREAEMTDPQQRFFLEVAWEGLEDAGYDPQRYRGLIGVFAGASLSTYLLFNLAPDVSIVGSGEHFPTLIGNDKDYLATHVSYKLNLRGPSMSIQTACSTSLVAIHMACQSLLNGECDIALAGGAAISVPQQTGYFYQEGAYFSPDGHCRSFAADARGTVFGSGVGVVVLKRLEDALRDNDCIDAVVKGSAINNDGAAKVGFTAPSVDGQAKVISEALSMAEVSPATIGYVETHGTATPLGDPIEVAALSLAFSARKLPPSSCAIGSVKSNVGHLDSAAGVAGFIKTVLSLKHAQIPPSLHCSTPNPEIDFSRTPFYVNSRLRPWRVRQGERRRAGVSSFGIGGTNAHLVLEETPRRDSLTTGMAVIASAAMTQALPKSQNSTEAVVYALPLSARHSQALRELALSYRNLLYELSVRSSSEEAPSQALRDICYSASVRRAHHSAHRLCVVGGSAQQMVQQLDTFLNGDPVAGLFARSSLHRRGAGSAAPRIAFVFSGQGAQWWGMGQQLLAGSGIFRQAIEEIDELFQRHTTKWRLLDELTAPEQRSRLDSEQIEITQCALFAMQVGLARMWQTFGVEPVAVIGHSMGEVAAAAVSGVLGLEQAVRLIYERGRLLQRAVGVGAMAAVELSEAEISAVLAGKDGRVSIAAVNGSRASVVSGERESVASLVEDLSQRGVMTRDLRTSGVAGHSEQVETVAEELERVLAGMKGCASDVAFISTVEGRRVEGEELDSRYWRRNLRERVRFAEGMRETVRAGAEVFVEMNAHPVLGLWVREAVQEDGEVERGAEVLVIGALRRERSAWEVTAEGLAELYVAGVEVNWEEVWRGAEAKYSRLPGYAWQRERFWIEPQPRAALRGNEDVASRESGSHPFLMRRMQSSILPNTHFWEADLETQLLPYLKDHRILETIVVPASFYIEMALAASRELLGDEAPTLEEVAFERALLVDPNRPRKLQLVISLEDGEQASFRFSSLQTKGTAKHLGGWVSHVSGKIRFAPVGTDLTTQESFLPEAILTRCSEVVSAADHYHELQERGLQYGPAFRCVQQVFRNREESIGRLQLPDEIAISASSYIVHPVLLDAGLQMLASLRGSSGNSEWQDIYLPVSLRSLRLDAPLLTKGVYWGYGIFAAADECGEDEVEGDLYILRENGSSVLEARGIRARRLVADDYAKRPGDMSDWFHRIEWVENPSRPVSTDRLRPTNDAARWLIFSDRTGFGDKLSLLIKNRGENVVRVFHGSEYQNEDGEGFVVDPLQPEHFRKLFAEAFGNSGSIRGIVHLWSMDAAQPPELARDSLNEASGLTCASVLHMIQALANYEGPEPPRLWLIARRSQVVEEGDEVTGLAQSMLWGLGKVVGIEHAELKCTRVDLDSVISDNETEAVWGELLGDFAEEEIAFRHGTRFVSQLVRFAAAEIPEPVEVEASISEADLIRSDGLYLITGGLGGLGLCAARWLVDQGARHLLLMSRKGVSVTTQIAVDSLRQAGAQVSIARADVSVYEQVAAALAEIEPESPPLAGVIHAAGVLDDGLLLTLDWERFQEVTKPKIDGAWNLHRLVHPKRLDFFVLFSSAGSMLGSAGQGNHVAGNSFLDALAHYRRAQGLPGLSINWSQWREVGKVAHVEHGERLDHQGIPGLSTAQGLRALELLLRQNAPQVGVMKFDLQQWSRFYPQAANSSLLRQFAVQLRERKLPENDRADVRAAIQAAGSARQQRALLEEFLQREVAWVLRVSPKDIPTDVFFSDLGLDSLRSLELRNRLEDGLNLTLPATLVWQFPTIEALAPNLAERIGLNGQVDEAAKPSMDDAMARRQSVIAELAQLSEAEAEALLCSHLENLQQTSGRLHDN